MHDGIEVKILYVDGHEADIWSGYRAVQDDLNSGKVCGFSADFVGVVDLVAAYRCSDAVHFGLMWFQCHYHSGVCWFTAER